MNYIYYMSEKKFVPCSFDTWTDVSDNVFDIFGTPPTISNFNIIKSHKNYMLTHVGFHININNLCISDDYGDTWTDISPTNNPYRYYDMYDNYIVLMAYNPGSSEYELFLSDDYGDTWTDISSKISGLTVFNKLVITKNVIIIAGGGIGSGVYDFLWYSDDYGVTFTNISSSHGTSSPNSFCNSLYANENIMIIGGDIGHEISFDYGDTWSSFGMPTTRFDAMVLNDKDELFIGVGSGGGDATRLLYSDDYGDTYTNIINRLPDIPAVFITNGTVRIESISAYENNMIICLNSTNSMYPDGYVFYSTDYGATFTNITDKITNDPANLYVRATTMIGNRTFLSTGFYELLLNECNN